MFDDLAFGWRTATLLVINIQLLLFATALWQAMANRVANRTLASLLIVMALIVTPWMIGFAGFYDRWSWLSFAPFQITLAVAPLAWLYITALVHTNWPTRGWRHLLPGIAQAIYLTLCFALPLGTKLAWDDASSFAYGAITACILVSQMLCYGLASRRLLAAYRAALVDNLAEEQRYAARWLSSAFIALALLFLVWSGFLLWDLVDPLGYRGLMGLYLAIAAAALFIGTEGWRHAERAFPSLDSMRIIPALTDDSVAARDWAQQGREWAQLIRTNGWARDPEITLGSLARLIGTNTNYLSRAINIGVGQNFSSFIARLRAEAVADRLRNGDGADLLAIALDEGFGSKASFNRAFRSAFNESPSTYRVYGADRE